MSDNKKSLREQFQEEIKAEGVQLLFESSGAAYIKWLEDKINEKEKMPSNTIGKEMVQCCANCKFEYLSGEEMPCRECNAYFNNFQSIEK